MRIATWNLQRPQKLNARLERLLDKIREVNADIWILTETHDVAIPGSDYRSCSSIEMGGIFTAGERRTTVWSRLPIVNEHPVADRETSACIEVETPSGRLIVYGTVLPYMHAGTNYAYKSGGQMHERRKGWEVHYESIAEHERDLKSLTERLPDRMLCFGGDLNQSRDGRRWGTSEYYGTRKGRDLLTQSLDNLGLRCMTEQDFVESGDLTTMSSVDHLCLSNSACSRVKNVSAWESPVFNDKPDTDHNGVVVEIELDL